MSELGKLVAEWHRRVEQIKYDHAHNPHKIEVLYVEPYIFPTINTLEEDTVEKRGVVTDDDKTKTAEETKRCPSCGMELEEPTKCVQCGTEPFERKPDASGQ